MVRRVRILAAACFAAACMLGAVAVHGADSNAPVPARVMLERLKKSGRAETRFTRTLVDPLSGKPQSTRGDLALELPMRVKIAFPSTKEQVTLREDGGEWLQPALQQLLVLGPERAAGARRWWDALLAEPGSKVKAKPAGVRRYELSLSESKPGDTDRAWVTLDAQGLPRDLEIDEGGEEPTRYRFEGWRFTKARGRAGFVLRAPSGIEVVEMP